MGMRVLFAALLLALPAGALAQDTLENAGFVRNTIWFSRDPFFAGETVRLYTAVFNSANHDLKGEVEFLVDGTGAGSSEFTATANGGAGIVWKDWEATEGEHSFAAALTDVRLSVVGEGERKVSLAASSVQGPKRFVDRDTDGDGVGNREDSDIDGDGISNAQEEARGTNPLVADEPAQEAEQEKEYSLLEPERFSGQLAALQKNGGIVLGAGEGIKKRVDEFARDQHALLEGGKLFYGSKIVESATSLEQEPFVERAGEYAALAAVSFSSFVFGNPLFLYILIVLLLLKGVQVVWNRVFFR